MDAHGDPPEKVSKARGKYLRTPATLVVGTASGDSPLRTAENRDAVAAGIQNLLLAATAAGLATYWGSCPKGANDVVAELVGWDSDTHVTALIYLGWATTEELRRLAVAQGMRTMLREAMALVESDVTTIPEVIKTLFAS